MSCSTASRARTFLALNSSLGAMLGMVILVGMGEHMAERFLPLYLESIATGTWFRISVGVLAVGLLAFLDDLLSALYSFPGGYLSDRLGAKRALLVFNGLSILGYLIVISIARWWAVLLGAACFISWSAISLPATMELIARTVPQNKRTMGVSLQSLVRRVPKTLGPLVGGAFIAVWGIGPGIRLAFGCAILLALLAAWLQQRFIADDRPAGGRGPAEGNPLRLYRWMNRSLRRLLLSDILIRFCERIPDAFVVIWVTSNLVAREELSPGRAAFLFGVLSAIENLTAVLCYVPVAHLADRFGKKPFVLMTFAFFTLFPLAALLATRFWALVPAFVLRGLKEFGEPTRKALIMDLAPENRKAAIFGLYYLIRDVIVSGAALSGAFLWSLSPRISFLTAFGFGAAGTLYFALFGRHVEREDAGAPA